MRIAGLPSLIWKLEGNLNILLLSVSQSETVPNTISLACCHISTFTLTVPVSRLTAQLITLPFRNSQHTKISLQLQFLSTPINRKIYSSFFRNFLQIQTTVKVQSLTFNCSIFFLAVPIIASYCERTRLIRYLKIFGIFFPSNNCNCRPFVYVCVWPTTIYLWVTECIWTYPTTGS